MKKKISWLWLLLAFIIGGVIGASGAKNDTATAATAATAPATTITVSIPAPTTITVSAPAAKESAPIAAPAPKPSTTTQATVSFHGDGTYAVGADIKAGTYKTAGPNGDNSMGCYWARLGDLSGGNILDNNIGKGQMTVTIKSSDKGFETSGCADWVKVG